MTESKPHQHIAEIEVGDDALTILFAENEPRQFCYDMAGMLVLTEQLKLRGIQQVSLKIEGRRRGCTLIRHLRDAHIKVMVPTNANIDTNTENDEGEETPPQRHSEWGIASCILCLPLAPLAVIYVFMAFMYMIDSFVGTMISIITLGLIKSPPKSSPEMDISLSLFVAITLLALTSGCIGLLQPNRKKLFAILGCVFSGSVGLAMMIAMG